MPVDHSLEAHPVLDIALQPDANRGLDVDLTKISLFGVSRVAGPTVQSGEPTDYTIYFTRSFKWDGVGGHPLRPVQVQLLYGAGASSSALFTLPTLPARGLCFHACVQTLRAYLLVQPQPTGTMPMDLVTSWICKGRPWTNRVTDLVNFSPVDKHDVPGFATRMRVESLTGDLLLAMHAELVFYDEEGLVVGEQELQSAGGPWFYDFAIPPKAVAYSIANSGGAQLAALVQWSVTA